MPLRTFPRTEACSSVHVPVHYGHGHVQTSHAHSSQILVHVSRAALSTPQGSTPRAHELRTFRDNLRLTPRRQFPYAARVGFLKLCLNPDCWHGYRNTTYIPKRQGLLSSSEGQSNQRLRKLLRFQTLSNLILEPEASFIGKLEGLA